MRKALTNLAKAGVNQATKTLEHSLSSLLSGGSIGGSWKNIIHEPFMGAWQRNMEISVDDSTRYFAVYSCVTLISNDIGKLPFLVKSRKRGGYWKEEENSPYDFINTRPNHYQNPSKFREQWTLSKLLHGNTYGLKRRDQKGKVVAVYILDPTRVTPLVSDESGEVFYRIDSDNLSSVDQQIVVPASEVIHDRMNCLFHPLIGIPPLYAAAGSAIMGKTGQEHMANFLRNASNPGGILVAPKAISETTAKNLKEYFESNFSGMRAGKIAVVGDGLTFQKLAISSSDSQLIEHMRWSAEAICACFHVPSFMVLGQAQAQASGNVQAMREQYYGQCLQSLINSMQECLDEGLELDEGWRIELDLEELLRADTNTRVTYLSNAIGGSVMTVNEARQKMGLPPVAGGDTIYMQQQNYSLSALDQRDRGNPFENDPTPLPAPVEQPQEVEDDEEQAREFLDIFERSMRGSQNG